MIASRRGFLSTVVGSLGLGFLGSSQTEAAWSAEDPPWLTYAIDLETFWSKRPFLERLKSLSETNFKHYEFSRFKTKDVFAISKASKEMDLTPVQFSVYEGLTDPKRKEPFLQALDDALEVAELFEVKRLVISAGELIKGVDRERQIDTVLDALAEAVEKVKESEMTLLFNPLLRKGTPSKRLVDDLKSAIELLADVNSPKLKLLVDLENGWLSNPMFVKDFREAAKSIGSIRLAEARLGKDTKTASLDPVGLLKLIHEVDPTDPVSFELGAKSDPIESLERLSRAEKAAKL